MGNGKKEDEGVPEWLIAVGIAAALVVCLIGIGNNFI